MSLPPPRPDQSDPRPHSQGKRSASRPARAGVHLRLCLSCGHVGCCDSSPGRHATRHFHETGDPVVASYEPGERWAWCYVDEQELPVPAGARAVPAIAGRTLREIKA